MSSNTDIIPNEKDIILICKSCPVNDDFPNCCNTEKCKGLAILYWK